MILQAQNKHSACISILDHVHQISIDLFGKSHLIAGSAMSQLTQAHFLNGDINKALECAKNASEIFVARLGPEDAQSKEALKNVELLSGALEHNAKVAEANLEAQENMRKIQESRKSQTAALNQRRRQALANALASSSKLPVAAAVAAATTKEGETSAEAEVAGEPTQEQMAELLQMVQAADDAAAAAKVNRGRIALRGKRRTGAKR